MVCTRYVGDVWTGAVMIGTCFFFLAFSMFPGFFFRFNIKCSSFFIRPVAAAD